MNKGALPLLGCLTTVVLNTEQNRSRVGGRQACGTEDFYPARVGAPHGTEGAALTGGRPHRAEGAALTGSGRPHGDRKCHPAHVDRRCRPAYWTKGWHFLCPCSPQKIQEKGGIFRIFFCTFSGSWIRPCLERPHRLKAPSLLLPSGGRSS